MVTSKFFENDLMAYTKTREALRIAKEKYGMSYQEIAILCGVSLGSVKRWMLNGRADEKAIRPLVEKIGQVYLSVSQVADHLIQLYKKKGGRENEKGSKVFRYRITNHQLLCVAGRQHLKTAFTNDLCDELRERGYLFIAGTDDYMLVSWQWLYDSCAMIHSDEIPDFYVVLANEIPSDEMDDFDF